jgi:pyruvate carboxylase
MPLHYVFALIATFRLIGAIRKAHPDIPIHVHSHDTAGIAAASMLACAAAGADVVDVAIDSKTNMISYIHRDLP